MPSELSPLLDRVALSLGAMAMLLRWAIGGTIAGTGLNLFIHLLFWVALAAWFAGRALEGGAIYRFSGLEFGFLAFVIAALVSVTRASYTLPALEHAMAYLSFAFLFILAVNVLGRGTLLSLLFPSVFALALYGILQYFVYFPDLLKTYDPAQHGPLTVEMERRIQSNRIFATFVGPNQFAGFLALFLPMLGGLLLDARRAGRSAQWTRGAALGLGLVSLALTRSLGGWIALGAGAATFAALAATRTRGRRTAVAAGAVVAAAAAALLLFSPLVSWMVKRSPSMEARAAYWNAAGRIVARSPGLGVGLDNFQEHYFEVKPETPQETRKAHNDFLQVLAEMGVPGLAAFLAILALGLRHALSRGATPTPDAPPPPGWLLPVAAATGFLLTWLLMGCPSDYPAPGLGVAWLAYHFMVRRSEREVLAGPLIWTRIGTASGLVALLVHMNVDFDFYEMGLAMSLFAALALGSVLRGGLAEVRLPGSVCAAAAGVLSLIFLPLLLLAAPRALAADHEISEADGALKTLVTDQRGGPGLTQRISDAIRLSEAAQGHNPFTADGYLLFARAKFREWEIRSAPPPREEAHLLDLQQIEEMILKSLENAIILRPRLAPLHGEKALFHRLFRRFYLRLPAAHPASRGVAEGRALEHLRLALNHERRALELYPTFSKSHYELGRLLDLDGDAAEARTHYQEALRFSDLAAREKWPVDRLQLEPLARARCLLRLGRSAEAHHVLVTAFARRPPSPPELEDELDEEMRPVIEAARKVILKPR